MSFDGSLPGVFDQYIPTVWDNTFEVSLHFQDIAGGTPSDPNVAEGWIRSKLKETPKDDRIRQAIEELMASRNFSEKEAVEELNKQRNVNGFLRDPKTGQLFIRGAQLKAALKEAAGVALASGKLRSGNKTKAGSDANTSWGKTGKGTLSFVAEHIQVLSTKVLLFDENWAPLKDSTYIRQSFPVNPRTKQTGIQYTEICEQARLKAMVTSDWDFTDEQWGTLWVTGELQGIGASRSQDFGRYKVIGWDRQKQASAE